MCFQLDSEPPIPAPTGGAVRGEDLTLSAVDGTSFLAFAGHPESITPGNAGIVILPDVRGLYRFYRDLALRFAAEGIPAVAIDYFGRTAGLSARDENFDFMPHVRQTRIEHIVQDVASAVAYLRQQPNGARRKLFTVGFCFGGGNSFLQASYKQGLAGVIGYYGRVAGESLNGAPLPIERVAEFECPVLGFFGGADQSIPPETVQQFDAALTEHGIEHELITYAGAPHSFFDRRYEEFANESADSWQRTLAFIRRHGA